MNKRKGLFDDWSINIACIDKNGKQGTLPFSMRVRFEENGDAFTEYRCNLCGYTLIVPEKEDPIYKKDVGLSIELPIPDVYEQLSDHLLGGSYLSQKCKGYDNESN